MTNEDLKAEHRIDPQILDDVRRGSAFRGRGEKSVDFQCARSVYEGRINSLIEIGLKNGTSVTASSRAALKARDSFSPSAQLASDNPVADTPKRVSDLAEFREYVAANQWSTRTDRGLSGRYGVLNYIRDFYGPWIQKAAEEGLRFSQYDLKQADPVLYDRFQQISDKPSWLDLPSEDEANLREIKDPLEKAILLGIRKKKRDEKRAERSRRNTP